MASFSPLPSFLAITLPSFFFFADLLDSPPGDLDFPLEELPRKLPAVLRDNVVSELVDS